MKKRVTPFIIALITAISILSAVSASAATGGIQWKGYDEGIAMAKADGKNIFLYFHADWCKYCHKMDATTFKDKKVIDYLNENYITIRVDADKETKVASKYGVRGMPTSWFLKANSDKLSNMPGFVDAKRLLTILKYVSTESYEKMSYLDFEKNMK